MLRSRRMAHNGASAATRSDSETCASSQQAITQTDDIYELSDGEGIIFWCLKAPSSILQLTEGALQLPGFDACMSVPLPAWPHLL